MKMDEAVKSAFQSEMDVEFWISNKVDTKIWDNINRNLPKERRFNKLVFLRHYKIIFLSCVFLITIISITYFFINSNSWVDKNNNKSFISIENKSGLMQSGNLIPMYVKFNDIYYSATGTYIQDEKIREVGENELEYKGNIFEIQGVPVTQKVALRINDNIYMIYRGKNIFDESEAISSLLKSISDENIKKLNFPAKSGCKESIVKIYDIDSNIKQIPIKLESKIENIGNKKFHIVLNVSWNSKDYNANLENSERLEHFWEFDVTPDKIVPFKQGGNQLFNLEVPR